MVLKVKRYSFRRRQNERIVENLARHLNKVRWKYKNFIIFIISILIAYALISTGLLTGAISGLKEVGYFGSLISGMFYAFSLTVAPSTAIFFSLGKTMNPFLVAVIGACGCVIGDYLIFRFVRDNLMEEIKLLISETKDKTNFYFKNSVFYRIFPFSNLVLSRIFKSILYNISHSKLWKWFITALACVIIATPMPDEIGIALLGYTKTKTKHFLIYSFLLNFAGIFTVAYLALA